MKMHSISIQEIFVYDEIAQILPANETRRKEKNVAKSESQCNSRHINRLMFAEVQS